MAKKYRIPNFDQVLDTLRSHAFDVSPYTGAVNGTLVSKYGAAAVLAQSSSAQPSSFDPATTFVVRPGILVQGEVAQLLDRGYQKFFLTQKFEIPATATQLHAVHQFEEELKQLAGITILFNEALGTTSDLYQYDRLQGRENAPISPKSPWDAAESH